MEVGPMTMCMLLLMLLLLLYLVSPDRYRSYCCTYLLEEIYM